MPAWILPAIQFGTQVIGAIRDGGGSSSSGSSTTPCGDQPSNADVTSMLAHASQAELTQLRSLYAAANPQAPSFPNSGFALAKAAVGGNDCQATSAAGQDLKSYFLSLVAKYRGAGLAGAGYAGNEATQVYDVAPSQRGPGVPGWAIALIVVLGVIGVVLGTRKAVSL